MKYSNVTGVPHVTLYACQQTTIQQSIEMAWKSNFDLICDLDLEADEALQLVMKHMGMKVC